MQLFPCNPFEKFKNSPWKTEDAGVSFRAPPEKSTEPASHRACARARTHAITPNRVVVCTAAALGGSYSRTSRKQSHVRIHYTCYLVFTPFADNECSLVLFVTLFFPLHYYRRQTAVYNAVFHVPSSSRDAQCVLSRGHFPATLIAGPPTTRWDEDSSVNVFKKNLTSTHHGKSRFRLDL